MDIHTSVGSGVAEYPATTTGITTTVAVTNAEAINARSTLAPHP
jgi:hypothetical protein